MPKTDTPTNDTSRDLLLHNKVHQTIKMDANVMELFRHSAVYFIASLASQCILYDKKHKAKLIK